MSPARNSSLAQQAAPTISRRAYNALVFGLVTVSFLVMWGMYQFATSASFLGMVAGLGSVGAIGVFIGSLVLTIGGIILMSVGKSKQSVPLSLVGFVLFTLTFGAVLGIGLLAYDIGTISYAFAITACVSAIFLIAGVTFPEFFARIGGVLSIGLIAVILVELVATVFFHADQTIFDYIVVILFCGFLGYDSLQMSLDEPTVPNAIWYASDIFLDVANILIRILSILDRD